MRIATSQPPRLSNADDAARALDRPTRTTFTFGSQRTNVYDDGILVQALDALQGTDGAGVYVAVPIFIAS